MKCPDCKNEELEKVFLAEHIDERGIPYTLDNAFYKCPKCRCEFDEEEIE